MDTWHQNPVRPAYTHHFNNGATRLDRIYTTRELLAKKIGIEILAAAFTDHHAVMLRIAVDTPILRMGTGRKMNTVMFRDISGQVKLRKKMDNLERTEKVLPGRNCMVG